MNSCLAAIDHPLAVRLADRAEADDSLPAPTSPLEHHHAAVAEALFQRPELDFLAADCTAERRARFIALVRDFVLCTDVGASVPSTVAEFHKSIRSNQWTKDEAVDPQVLMRLVLRVADASHAARPLPVSSKWFEG